MATKAELVNTLKHLQRSNPAAKEAWSSYCDEHLGGLKDPNRHDVSALQYFVDAYCGGDAAALAPSPLTAFPPVVAEVGTPKASLVEQCKSLQRSNPSAKDAWAVLCDTQLNGVKDPNRHDIAVLQYFVDTYGGGAAIAASPQLSGFAAPAAAGTSKSSLVEQCKSLQRSNPSAKEAWATFCDMQLNGVRDPNRHDDVVLQKFLSSVGVAPLAPTPGPAPAKNFAPAGAGACAGGPGTAAVFAEAIKAGQRVSQLWKNSWAAYVEQSGKKAYDPAKHDDAFLVGFFDKCGEAYHHMFQVGAGGALLDPSGEPPAKRARVGGAQDVPTGDAHFDDLVKRVKTLQRASDQTKQAWLHHADELYNGTRDPAKHPIESLEHFLAAHESSLT